MPEIACAHGNRNYLVQSVELYHLERQSQNMIGETELAHQSHAV